MTLSRTTIVLLACTVMLIHLLQSLPRTAARSSSSKKCKVKVYSKSSFQKPPSNTFPENRKRRRANIDQHYDHKDQNVPSAHIKHSNSGKGGKGGKGGPSTLSKIDKGGPSTLSKIDKGGSKSPSHSHVDHNHKPHDHDTHTLVPHTKTHASQDPPHLTEYYNDEIGNWHWHYKSCGESEAPSQSPTRLPTSSPTRIASVPTSAPSTSPSDTIQQASSPWCERFYAGEVYETNLNTTIVFKYELLSDSSSDITTTLSNLQDKLQSALANALMDCTQQRRQLHSPVVGLTLQHSSSNHRHLRVNGIDMSPNDTIDSSLSCSTLKIFTDKDQCDVIDGSVTVYLQDDAAESSVLQSGQNTLKAIQNSMNSLDLVDPTAGIMGTFYLGGAIGEFEVEDSESTTFIAAANVAEEPIASSKSTVFSSTGISILTVAAVLTTGIALILTRRQRLSHVRLMEHWEEDEVTIAKDWDSKPLFPVTVPDDTTDGVSCASSFTTSSNWKTHRGAHVVGEGDSIFSKSQGSEATINFPLYGTKHAELEVGYHDDEKDKCRATHDVHNCTSATCPMCDRWEHRPDFVDSGIKSPSVTFGVRKYSTDSTVDL